MTSHLRATRQNNAIQCNNIKTLQNTVVRCSFLSNCRPTLDSLTEEVIYSLQCKGLSTPGNKENGNKLPETATICCRKRQQFVAGNGNCFVAENGIRFKLLPETATKLPFLLLPKTATHCCRFGQQFVAVSGNNLLRGVDRP